MCSVNVSNEILSWKEHDLDHNYFDREKTLKLIHLYKENKPKVASGYIKTMKRLWEILAREMSNAFKITISPAKCENKFRVLERNYKKVVDNNNKTGMAAKAFEFQTEFDEIFGKKANYRLLLLLTNNESIVPTKVVPNLRDAREDAMPSHEEGGEIVISLVEDENSQAQEPQPTTSTPRSIPMLAPGMKRKRRNANRDGPFYKKRNDILVEMNDLKEYYDKKLEIEKEKLEINKKKLEDRLKRTTSLELHNQPNFFLNN